MLRNFLQEIVCLLGRAQIRSDRHLKDIGKSQLPHRRTKLSGRYLRSELSDKRRRQRCIYPLSRTDRADYLENL